MLFQVAFCEVSVEDIPPTGVDDLSVKLIRLSQLTIEYLLHVQVRYPSVLPCLPTLGKPCPNLCTVCVRCFDSIDHGM